MAIDQPRLGYSTYILSMCIIYYGVLNYMYINIYIYIYKYIYYYRLLTNIIY